MTSWYFSAFSMACRMTRSCWLTTTIFSFRSLRLSSSDPIRNRRINATSPTVNTANSRTRLRDSTDHLLILENTLRVNALSREKCKGPVRVRGIDLRRLKVGQAHRLLAPQDIGEIRVGGDRFDQLVHPLWC